MSRNHKATVTRVTAFDDALRTKLTGRSRRKSGAVAKLHMRQRDHPSGRRFEPRAILPTTRKIHVLVHMLRRDVPPHCGEFSLRSRGEKERKNAGQGQALGDAPVLWWR